MKLGKHFRLTENLSRFWGHAKKNASAFWNLINKNASAIQVLISLIGFVLIFIAISSLKIENQRFELDYGRQVEVTFSGSNVYANYKNALASNLRMQVSVYMQFSDKRYAPVNDQYIEVMNFFEPEQICDVLSCFEDDLSLSPLAKKISIDAQLYDLGIIFNATPTKLYPRLVCIIQIDYSDAEQVYRKEFFVADGCLNSYFARTPTQFTEEQLKQFFKGEVLGKIDYSKTGALGFVSPYFTKRMTALLAQYRWKERFVEPSSLRWYRTMYRYEVPR